MKRKAYTHLIYSTRKHTAHSHTYRMSFRCGYRSPLLKAQNEINGKYHLPNKVSTPVHSVRFQNMGGARALTIPRGAQQRASPSHSYDISRHRHRFSIPATLSESITFGLKRHRPPAASTSHRHMQRHLACHFRISTHETRSD